MLFGSQAKWPKSLHTLVWNALSYIGEVWLNFLVVCTYLMALASPPQRPQTDQGGPLTALCSPSPPTPGRWGAAQRARLGFVDHCSSLPLRCPGMTVPSDRMHPSLWLSEEQGRWAPFHYLPKICPLPSSKRDLRSLPMCTFISMLWAVEIKLNEKTLYMSHKNLTTPSFTIPPLKTLPGGWIQENITVLKKVWCLLDRIEGYV